MALIKNYGLFWSRERVEFEKRSGNLLGLGVRQKTQGVVDFATQRGIYALYDENFRLIYVGQAGRAERRLYRRLRAHTQNNLADRWTRFSWFGICSAEETIRGKASYRSIIDTDKFEVDRKTVLDHMEAILIMAAEPIRNAKGGVFGPDVVHYRQFDKHRFDEQIDELDSE